MKAQDWFLVVALVCYLIFLYVAINADAVRPGSVRTVYTPNNSVSASTTTTLPARSTYCYDANVMKRLNNLHAPDGAAAYQAGYSDAIDDLLGELGVRENKFSRRPAYHMELNPNLGRTFTFKEQAGGMFFLNTSQYAIELRNRTHIVPFLNKSINSSDYTWWVYVK